MSKEIRDDPAVEQPREGACGDAALAGAAPRDADDEHTVIVAVVPTEGVPDIASGKSYSTVETAATVLDQHGTPVGAEPPETQPQQEGWRGPASDDDGVVARDWHQPSDDDGVVARDWHQPSDDDGVVARDWHQPSDDDDAPTIIAEASTPPPPRASDARPGPGTRDDRILPDDTNYRAEEHVPSTKQSVDWQPFRPVAMTAPTVEAGPTYGGDGGMAAHVAPTGFEHLDPPDSVIDYAEVDGLSIRAASVRGRSHRIKNTPRQDDYRLGMTSDANGTNHLCIAVCDGLGSGVLSHLAASVTATVAIEEMTAALSLSRLHELDWASILEALNHRVVNATATELTERNIIHDGTKGVRRHMATTLVFAVARLDRTEIEILGGSIGDSSAWHRTSDGLRPLTRVKNEGADLASSSVQSVLPSSSKMPAWEPFHCELAAGEALFLVSDGIGDPIGAGNTRIATEIHGDWKMPPDPYSFAAKVNFAAKAFDDDRTAVGVWVPQEYIPIGG